MRYHIRHRFITRKSCTFVFTNNVFAMYIRSNAFTIKEKKTTTPLTRNIERHELSMG